ncbi:hypothetical protein BGZ80_008629 [Entomortierella chlamydospora]|uniref:Uncharacterized protein n=1 Tax=Entomortierella chlamydospora TaxID=101097 RepID=A0A9P6T175_9FUNG|nr:hypothetical protein BGZ80_008629 [Entomortierella chlamydospora]
MVGEISINESSETAEVTEIVEEVDDIPETGDAITGILDPAINGTINGTQGIQDQPATQPLSPILASTSAAAQLSISSDAHLSYDPHQTLVSVLTQNHSRAATSSSSSSPPRPFLASWPLTMEQTQSLVYLDLRHAVVTDSLVVSLSLNCHRIEFLKVATHWQHHPHCYSVTDHALACLVAAQQGLKLVHVENHREVSQGHELVRTIDVLASHHGSTLETLVLKLHDFQNCNLAALGKSCQKLTKFAAPGGMHLFREEVTKLTDACKLTLEHLDFSNSDIETDCLTSIMKGTSTPAAARGVLKALVLLGMEDTLNQETCLAIGEYGSGLDCFRLDILESEAKDVSLMLSRPCGQNLRVLTLGCHDVHGDLANNILEQIALNCRNVELLDVNHWQFSAKAIEDVLRDCGMLRYLNVSYTDITESTADVICRCLGEVKMRLHTPVGPSSDDSLSTPLPIDVVSSQLQTLAPAHSEEGLALDAIPAQEEWIDEETHARDVETEGEISGNLDEERPDSMRKRGTEMRVKDGEETDEAYVDTNMDSDLQHVIPVFSANGGGGSGVKKQSQLGLVHHYSNVMDLRTIMNLDLDEAIEMDISAGIDGDTDMDLDMCLDLQRYHRNNSYKNEGCGDDREDDDDDDDDGDDGTVERDEDIEMMSEDDEAIARPKEPKGKEVYVGPDYDDSSQNGASSIFSAIGPVYSSSYGSTSSSSSSSSTSGSCSSSTFVTSVVETNQTQSGQVPLTAEASMQDSFLCTPLLPPLPIPSKQGGILGTDPVAVLTCTSVPSVNDQIQSAASPIPEVSSNQSKILNGFDSSNLHTPTHPMTTGAEVDDLETPLLVDGGETTQSLAPAAKQSLEPETESEESLSLSLAWTKTSRLEQGRKKSRIWVENEHDMMMTRLAMERGPELPVTTSRINEVAAETNSGASIVTVSNDSNANGNSDSQLPPTSGSEESMETADQQEAVQGSQLYQESTNGLSTHEDESMTAATTVEVVA